LTLPQVSEHGEDATVIIIAVREVELLQRIERMWACTVFSLPEPSA